MKLYVNTHIAELDLESSLAALPPQRREQALRYRREHDRKLCAAAYQLLRRGVNECFGLAEAPALSYGSGGKPSVAGHPEIHFNLSHCREAAVCAVDTVPVGVDVESIRPLDDAVAERVLSAAELARVRQSLWPQVEFIRLWTMKEALLKLTGEGISRDLKTVIDHARYRFATVIDLPHHIVYTTCHYR